MLPISSPQNPIIKLIRSLDDKKARREHGLFVAEGHAMLERAEALGFVPEHVIATKNPYVFEDVKPSIVTEKLMAELSAQNNPHEVLATFKQKWQPHPSKEGSWLALEDIRDPGNLGAIIRTADAGSAAGIILVGDCCDPYAPESVRASTGSIFAVPLIRMPTEQFVDFAKVWPGSALATRMDAKVLYTEACPAPYLIVLGSESKGLSDSISSSCGRKVRIPMKQGVESLNVATAAALMLYRFQN